MSRSAYFPGSSPRPARRRLGRGPQRRVSYLQPGTTGGRCDRFGPWLQACAHSRVMPGILRVWEGARRCDAHIISYVIDEPRRRPTVSLIRAEDELLKLLDSLAFCAEAMFAINERHRIVFWNQQAQRLLGWTYDDVVGKACVTILAGDDRF